MSNPYYHVPRTFNRSNKPDVHELQMREVNAQNNGGVYDWNSASMPGYGGNGQFNNGMPTNNVPQAIIETHGFEDHDLYFDSTRRDLISDYSVGEIIWPIPPMNNNQNITSCIVINIGEFYFPKIYASSNKPEFFYFNRLFMEIVPVSSTQSTLTSTGQRFHFECAIEQLTGQAVKIIPIRESFYFRRPITDISEFKIKFWVPQTIINTAVFKTVTLPADTVTITSLTTGGFGYNPIRFQISNATTAILGLVGSLGSPGVAVFITSYASNISAVNTSVNDAEGVYATTVVDSTTFSIAGIDASAVTAQYTATMYIPKNRIAFPVRFTSRLPNITNDLDISHS